MAQWCISLTDRTQPEGQQLIGYVVVEGDWPADDRVCLFGGDITVVRAQAMVMGPAPSDSVVPEEFVGRLLRTKTDIEAAGGEWPYGDRETIR